MDISRYFVEDSLFTARSGPLFGAVHASQELKIISKIMNFSD
jgi:hypothetical protein